MRELADGGRGRGRGGAPGGRTSSTLVGFVLPLARSHVSSPSRASGRPGRPTPRADPFLRSPPAHRRPSVPPHRCRESICYCFCVCGRRGGWSERGYIEGGRVGRGVANGVGLPVLLMLVLVPPVPVRW